MSATLAATPAATPSTALPMPPALRPGLFMDRLIGFLIPYFLPLTPDLDRARAEIRDTITAYGARTRAEMLNVVQIIAFSFSALDLLAEAKALEQEIPAPQRLRYRSCANGLSRCSQQNERTLARRLACDQPGASQPAAEPADDVPNAEAAAILQQARTAISLCRNRLSGARPATGPYAMPASQKNQTRRPGSPMMQALFDEGTAIEAAGEPGQCASFG
jgi:hypothetical protein